MSATPDYPDSEPAPVAKDAALVTAEYVVTDLHVAPSEPHPLKLNLWQRWMAWSGSFFVLSLLIHVLLIGVATFLVVQVVAGRKEKIKFTAPPPSAAGPKTVEHKVKPPKSTASAPSVSKRIISTAPSATIALPPMAMSSSSSPDVMADVMRGLGTGSLGVGATTGVGAVGVASMPSGGLTAFGYKGASSRGFLVGHLYDLKQTPDRHPTEIHHGSPFAADREFLNKFFKNDWDESLLEKYYKARDPLNAYQIWVHFMPAEDGPKAFGVEKDVPQGSHWVVLYKGTVIAPKGGRFRFVGFADDYIAVRFDKNVVLSFLNGGDHFQGDWFTVEPNKPYPIEIIMGEVPGGGTAFFLWIEDENPEKPYPPGMLPVFQVRKGAPLPPSKKGQKFENAPESIVFPAQ